MNAYFNPGDPVLIWAVNTLLQLTLVTMIAILVAAWASRRPALKSGILTASLILTLLLPGISAVSQFFGFHFVYLNLQGNEPERSTRNVAIQHETTQDITAHHDSLPAVSAYDSNPVDAVAVLRQEEPSQPHNSAEDQRRPFAKPDIVEVTQHIEANEPTHSVADAPTNPLSIVRGIMPCVLYVWLSGTVFFMFRHFAGRRRLNAILQNARQVSNSVLRSCFVDVCGVLRVRRKPELFTAPHIGSPMAVGWQNPRILLPDDITERLTPQEMRSVLTHETAHIIRRDPLIVWLQNAATCLFWLHPLVWILNRQIARAREEVCDNFVLTQTDAPSYSRTLLMLAEFLQERRQFAGSVGLLNSGWKLESRIAGLLDTRRDPVPRLAGQGKAVIAGLSIGIACLAFGATIGVAQTEVSPPASEKLVQILAEPATDGIGDATPATVNPQTLKPVASRQPADEEIEEAKRIFRRSRSDAAARLKAAGVLYPLIQPEMPRTDVLNLLGPPDRFPKRERYSRFLNYLIDDGKRIEIEFDRDREQVVSKLELGLGIDPPQEPIPPIPKQMQTWLADYAVEAKNESDRTVLRAGFVPYKSDVVWGEPLTVTMTAANIGKGDFEFMFGGDYRGTGRHDRIKIMVTDADRNELPDPHANAPNFGGISSFEIITPRGSKLTRTFDLTKYRTITEPGRYTVTCSFAFDEPHANLKGPRKPVIRSRFPLTILARTPERVANVLDELQQKVATTSDDQLPSVMTSIAQFGQGAAISRLNELARVGPTTQRTAAISALPLIPNDAVLDVVLACLSDTDPAVRKATASALGHIPQERSINALLDLASREETPVKEAALVALGTTKSASALKTLADTLEDGSADSQAAAISALVQFGGEAAVKILQRHVTSPDFAFRFRVVDALVSKLRMTLDPDWLLPILMTRRHNNREWLGSLSMIRIRTGEDAVPVLLSCVDYDIPWSHRNYWILHNVKYAKGAPKFDYTYDPNSTGTPDDHEKNRQTLKMLRKFSGPIPRLTQWPTQPVPVLETDPRISFTTTLWQPKGENELAKVKCGFFQQSWNRNGGTVSFKPLEAWRPTFQIARNVRAILNSPEHAAASGMNEQQILELRKLEIPRDTPVVPESMSLLYIWWMESPEGPIRERAKTHLCDRVRAAVQKHHTDHVAFAAMARRIMGPVQQRTTQTAQQQFEASNFGVQRIDSAMKKSKLWLDLKARLDSSPVKYRWIELDSDGTCRLSLDSTPVSDLSHLKGARLHHLNLEHTAVRDLSPLKGMPLSVLTLSGSQVQNLAPLKGIRLTSLNLSHTDVRDLSPLENAELKSLIAIGTPITDLSPLEGMPLEYVDLRKTGVSDLTPIVNDQLKSLQVEDCPVTDIRPLSKAPLATLWLGNIDDLDLAPLSEMNLTTLTLQGKQVTDVTVIRNMKLNSLWLNDTNVRDLAPLKEMPLTELYLTGTPITDLTPLTGMKLKTLFLTSPGIDLTPLAGMPLENIGIRSISTVAGIDVLRRIKSLKSIRANGKPMPVDDFWRRYDAGEFDE